MVHLLARREDAPSFVESRPCLRGPPSRGLGVAGFLVVTPRLPYLRLKGVIRKVRGVFLFGCVQATSDDKSHLLIALRGGCLRLGHLLFQDIALNLLPLGFNKTSIILPLLLCTGLEVCFDW